MVWEQNCPVIVMLTRLVENSVEKAALYWPKEEGETAVFGNISVHFSRSFPVGDLPILIRSFKLKRVEGGDPRGAASCETIGLISLSLSVYVISL
jgi:protein tyrosine phosphatase